MDLYIENGRRFIKHARMGKLPLIFGAVIDGNTLYFDSEDLRKTVIGGISSPLFGVGEQSVCIYGKNGVELKQTVLRYAQCVLISMEITNNTENDICLDELILLEFSPEDEGFFAAEDLSVYKCGAMKNKVCAFYKNDRLKELLSCEALVSSMMSMLTTARAEDALLLGFTSFKNQYAEIRYGYVDNKSSCKCVCSCDEISLARGESMASETLMLKFGEPFSLLSDYADTVKKLCGARAAEKPPTGWCSFYTYYGCETEERLLKELHYFHANGFKLDFFQIDDGWQNYRGDWEANEKFPHGMKWFADEIHKRGFKAGIWISPFITHSQCNLYKEHSDWFLRDGEGKPRLFGSSNDNYVLDMSRPEVLEWLSALIKKLVYEWGYDYIKIDFLRALTAPGIRGFKYNVTRAQAYRRALEVMREAAGDHIYILGCGGHFGPDIGIVNGNRTSADTYASWNRLKANCENNLTKFWMDRTLWNNDPDAVVIRGPGEGLMEDNPVPKHMGQIADEEMKVALTAAYVSGGMYMPGDSLPLLPDHKVELLRRFFKTAPKAGIPRDMFSGRPPQVFDVVHESGKHEVAVFNFEDAQTEFSYDVGFMIGNAEGKYSVTEYWTKREYGTLSARDTLHTEVIPAHSCRLYIFDLI